MARGRLSENEITILKKNPNVQDASETRILYTNKFKYHFMKEYLEGKRPTQIFVEAGFDAKILGSKRIECAASRWRESYAAGTLGSYQDGTIRKQQRIDVENLLNKTTHEECIRIIKKQQAEIDRLKAEIEVLKHSK